MNVHEYEAIMADPERVKSGVLGMFYSQSRRPTYGIVRGERTQIGWVEGGVKWSELPAEAVERMTRMFDRALRAAVDDYTTPGCECDYCEDCHAGRKPRLLMCEVRWNSLPYEDRAIIAESVND